MGWPQWTWICLVGLGWLCALVKHGQKREDKHDVGISTAGVGVSVFLLWQGGFFG